MACSSHRVSGLAGRKRVLRRWFWVLVAVCATTPIVALGQDRKVECPEVHGENQPPEYPQHEFAEGISGVVVLVVDVGVCGEVENVAVERSSGWRSLDRAASEAAKSWHFRPRGDGLKGVVQFPVEFNPDQGAKPSPIKVPAGRENGFFPAPDSLRAPTPRLSSAGHVPGYVQDPYPFIPASVIDARLLATRYANAKTSADGMDTEFDLVGDFGFVEWHFANPGSRFYPSAIRLRQLNDGDRGFVVTAYRCEASASDCAELGNVLTSRPDQPDMRIPPPPPPPPKP